jgi:hypothetical protein
LMNTPHDKRRHWALSTLSSLTHKTTDVPMYGLA